MNGPAPPDFFDSTVKPMIILKVSRFPHVSGAETILGNKPYHFTLEGEGLTPFTLL